MDNKPPESPERPAGCKQNLKAAAVHNYEALQRMTERSPLTPDGPGAHIGPGIRHASGVVSASSMPVAAVRTATQHRPTNTGLLAGVMALTGPAMPSSSQSEPTQPSAMMEGGTNTPEDGTVDMGDVSEDEEEGTADSKPTS